MVFFNLSFNLHLLMDNFDFVFRFFSSFFSSLQDGFTALIHGSLNGDCATVQCLLEAGANTEAKSKVC
jgi:ankyrin repeat protein